jgi:hypothetical protein
MPTGRYSRDVPFLLIRVCQKLKIKFTILGTTSFFGRGLSGSIFGTC